MRHATAFAAVLLLAGCGAMQPTDSDLTARDWAKPGVRRAAAQEQIWCYRTLGRPDCTSTPLPGQEYRLIEGGPQPGVSKPLPPDATNTLGDARRAVFGE